MRILHLFRKANRRTVQRPQGQPDIPRLGTRAQKLLLTGTYSEILNLPVLPADPIQDPSTGKLLWMADVDALP